MGRTQSSVLGLVDRGSVLLVVYVAFSEGMTRGIWHQLDAANLATLLLADAALLAAGTERDHADKQSAAVFPGR